MQHKKFLSTIIITMFSAKAIAVELSQEQLGQLLFFDPNLSKNRTQSCSTCHDPARAFSDGRQTPALGITSVGDDGHSFGNRNAPTATYANTSPPFHYDEKLKEYVGGQFWDGRAATLADQAGGPPLNPIEMGMPDEHTVVGRLKENPAYEQAMKALYSKDIFEKDDHTIYTAMTKAIEAFEKTNTFSHYSSKYDKFLRGEYQLTALEDLGRTLFFSQANVNCSTCHKLKPEDAKEEPFTNHQYRNIGVPSNPNTIKYGKLGADYIDHGLLENPAVTDKKYDGKFKIPTLRNVAVTGPYMHNGVFQHLRTVVEFYDKYNNPDRKINPETGKPWAVPEVPDTVDLKELKATKLSERKIDALVAFMRALTDEEYESLLKAQDEAEAKERMKK
ncbi:cytochrome-c peroxidase [Suttonella ornithocola]|uniref:Methylamine utilization protein MauG n=1 Tax=Suttonella ornithocola TaxID=279832 RepID=A0A380MUL4_9GAMM|nr:cytochrome c peroxidase [Suttonella ornithocola]SUO96275.1 Methylamine utilization protein MauG precursor [Suttonella ornithocola]